MSTKNIATLLTLVLVALTAAGCAGNEQVSEDNNTKDQGTIKGSKGEKDRGPEATLELQGEPGTEFSGSCAVGNKDSEEISGQVPESFAYELKERPLKCEISSDGEIQVDLVVGSNVHSIQRISGGTLTLTYENGSISSFVSSSAESSREGSSSSSSQGATSSETSDVTS